MSMSMSSCPRLIQRFVMVTNCNSQRGARWTKPWRVGPKENWNKGIYDYSWKQKRAAKVAKVELPNFDELRVLDKLGMSPEEQRSYQKEKGIVPNRSWNEKPITMTHTGFVFEPYIPKESGDDVDDKFSEGIKDTILSGLSKYDKKLRKNFLALRKMRTYLENFDPKLFAINEAFDIYVKSHEMMAKLSSNPDQYLDDDDYNQIFDLVTEKAYPAMIHNMDRKTISWKLIKKLEEPKTVHIRTERGMDSGDLYSQVTVRFHTQQLLAVYDRFGRLLFGSENIVKDVLEYVVFENHIVDIYSKWRLHHKIIPDWVSKSSKYAKSEIHPTYRKLTVDEDEEKEETEEEIEERKKKYERKVIRPAVLGPKYVQVSKLR